MGLDAPLFQELQLLRRSINIHLKYYDKKGLTEEIKRTTDRDTLRSLGERLRAIPFNEKDFEESLPEEAIKQRAIELLKKFEARWGTLLTKSDAESYERCRLARDDFDHLFREWCQKQSDQLVRRLEELISHWKDLNMETKGPTSTDGTPNTSTVTNFEDAFNEMTKLLPEEIKGHYNEVLEKMKQEIPLAVSE